MTLVRQPNQKSSPPATPFFLKNGVGNIYSIYHKPKLPLPQKIDVVVVPPFAEEMNKSRRMFSLLADQLNFIGIGVLIFDLYGTGDSEGDFSEASWEQWKKDLDVVTDWLRSQGNEHLFFLSLRLGSLLAVDYISSNPGAVEKSIMWQPVVNGGQFLTQFLRLRIAASMVEKSNNQESMADLKRKLEEGRLLEIAGYRLSSDLYAAISEKKFIDLIGEDAPPLHWLELVASEERSMSIGNKNICEIITNSGYDLSVDTVVGDPFWSLQEITIAENLLDKTVEHLNGLIQL